MFLQNKPGSICDRIIGMEMASTVAGIFLVAAAVGFSFLIRRHFLNG
jgi:hypothetical protein